MSAERQVGAMEIYGGGVGVGGWLGGQLLLTACKKKKDVMMGRSYSWKKQIESLFLLKELPSSLECWPCGAEKQPSALQRSGPTTRSLELPLQYREIK